MSSLQELRAKVKKADAETRRLRIEREKAEHAKYEAEREIWSLPCGTKGWTDDELSSHIFHMHDSVGYVHVGNGIPRKILESVHEMIKAHKRLPYHNDLERQY